jgi:hypothetical protein
MRETSSALASPRVRSAAHKSKSRANWRGSGKVFGDKLQWVMQDGRPGAAIIPVWRVNITKDGAEREVQERAQGVQATSRTVTSSNTPAPLINKANLSSFE